MTLDVQEMLKLLDSTQMYGAADRLRDMVRRADTEIKELRRERKEMLVTLQDISKDPYSNLLKQVVDVEDFLSDIEK